jgi:hypothetical protein
MSTSFPRFTASTSCQNYAQRLPLAMHSRSTSDSSSESSSTAARALALSASAVHGPSKSCRPSSPYVMVLCGAIDDRRACWDDSMIIFRACVDNPKERALPVYVFDSIGEFALCRYSATPDKRNAGDSCGKGHNCSCCRDSGSFYASPGFFELQLTILTFSV